MPSTITHSFIGLDTLKKLNHKPKKIIENRINNYKIYCQNMDVLYFYHILLLKKNNVQELGHIFHNQDTFKSFKIIIDDIKENKDEELFTFLAGLITHYQADSIMHPYINYLSYNKNHLLMVDKHFEIETYLDNYYIRKNLNNDYKKFDYNNFQFNYTKEKIIEKEIDKIFNSIFNYNNMGKKYYIALDNMKFVNKYIRFDKYGIKRKIYQFIDINPFNLRRVKYLSYHFNLDNDEYYLNLNNKEWFNYLDKTIKSNKSFLELYDEVTKKASFIINELYEYLYNNKQVNLEKLIGNISYSTGLKLK